MRSARKRSRADNDATSDDSGSTTCGSTTGTESEASGAAGMYAAEDEVVGCGRAGVSELNEDVCLACSRPAASASCCHRCPAAFHSACLPRGYATYGLPWHCPSCARRAAAEAAGPSGADSVPRRPQCLVSARVGPSGSTFYLVKWEGQPYDACTWEAADTVAALGGAQLVSQLASRPVGWARRPGPYALGLKQKGAAGLSEAQACFPATPAFLSGGKLHPYQLEGLRWLFFNWVAGTNVILADEMGLGKTVQAVSFLRAVSEEAPGRPHLVVAPLSTLSHWERELAAWAPDLNVVTLHGNPKARDAIVLREFFGEGTATAGRKGRAGSDKVRFDVLLTNYENVKQCRRLLSSILWECMVVDEGHRLRARASKLSTSLGQLTAASRVLLTGTPLQNNLSELLTLARFVDPVKFKDMDALLDEFSRISEKEQVEKLHDLLRPHMLRRMKADVNMSLPPMRELLVRVEMSATQKKFYRDILASKFPVLAGSQGRSSKALLNVVDELRKVCNHPYLFPGAEPLIADQAEAFQAMLRASGKLSLLHQMCVKLRERGHRCLIVSQFTSTLDVLERWLRHLGWGFERIDGTVGGLDRQPRIDRFNAPGSTAFAFLLSTRAGGLGINLATADTVFIFDSDWNPHNDRQALARAHRLGQGREVMVYRFVTRATVEERMMECARRKLLLEHVVVQGMGDRGGVKQSELDEVLRHGTRELFAEEDLDRRAEEELAGRGSGEAGAGVDGLQGQPEARGGEGGAEGGAPASGVAGVEGGGEGDAGAGRSTPALEAAGPGARVNVVEHERLREREREGRGIVWDEEALERVLDRQQAYEGGDGEAGEANFLSSFKVASYTIVEGFTEKDGLADQPEPEGEAAAPRERFWEELLGQFRQDEPPADAAPAPRAARMRPNNFRQFFSAGDSASSAGQSSLFDADGEDDDDEDFELGGTTQPRREAGAGARGTEADPGQRAGATGRDGDPAAGVKWPRVRLPAAAGPHGAPEGQAGTPTSRMAAGGPRRGAMRGPQGPSPVRWVAGPHGPLYGVVNPGDGPGAEPGTPHSAPRPAPPPPVHYGYPEPDPSPPIVATPPHYGYPDTDHGAATVPYGARGRPQVSPDAEGMRTHPTASPDSQQAASASLQALMQKVVESEMGPAEAGRVAAAATVVGGKGLAVGWPPPLLRASAGQNAAPGLEVYGLDGPRRKEFLRLLLTWGLGLEFQQGRLPFWAKDFQARNPGCSVVLYLGLVFSHLTSSPHGGPPVSPSLTLFGVSPSGVFKRIAHVEIIRRTVQAWADRDVANFRIWSPDGTYPLPETPEWGRREDLELLRATMRHGLGMWSAIVKDPAMAPRLPPTVVRQCQVTAAPEKGLSVWVEGRATALVKALEVEWTSRSHAVGAAEAGRAAEGGGNARGSPSAEDLSSPLSKLRGIYGTPYGALLGAETGQGSGLEAGMGRSTVATGSLGQDDQFGEGAEGGTIKATMLPWPGREAGEGPATVAANGADAMALDDPEPQPFWASSPMP